MTREQLIAAMHDAFCAASPDGAERWGAVADVVERHVEEETRTLRADLAEARGE